MGKSFKINLPKKQTPQPAKEKVEPVAPSAGEKTNTGAGLETKKKPASTRLKDDSIISSALKQAEKTLAKVERTKEAEAAVPAPRKARIIADETKPKIEVPPPVIEQVAEPVIEESEEKIVVKPEAPKTEQATPKPATPAVTSKPVEQRAPAFGAPRKPDAGIAAKKDLKAKKPKEESRFDARDRQGLRDAENEAWRRKRQFKPQKKIQQEDIVRPKTLAIRLPITLKDLAHEMKLKGSQLVAKLFAMGLAYNLTSIISDETDLQLLGHEFGCAITIDTSEEKRIRITEHSIRDEIAKSSTEKVVIRPPVVAFMGHVDHGKTSLIDAIRKSNRAAHEAGAITQHIGAFKVKTAAGDVTILDTPGHEAFSEMRARGANVTDIVILVVAGDEGIRTQTEEAIAQARSAQVPILVAINKCDKPNFDEQIVYRQLADRDLLPESWGGTVITVNCSATTGKGIKELLEMIALQAEVLELRADPTSRARGTVLESEMRKGLGAVATVLVQNGTLRKNHAIVFGSHFGRIKTMQDEYGNTIESAGPSSPVEITGLSDLAPAGFEFVVVENEKEARKLAEARAEGAIRAAAAQSKLSSLEKMMAKKAGSEMKILPVILKADMQGSLEALISQLNKIESKKVRLEIVETGVGLITESDISLASASKSMIIGFHTDIQSSAADLNKQKRAIIIQDDLIYALRDKVQEEMKKLLDQTATEVNLGEAEVRAIFKSSKEGNIAGCIVNDGMIRRTSLIRQLRDGKVLWTGKLKSLKRMKEDVKEIIKGFECGVVLDGQTDVKEGDIFQSYEIHYSEQEL